MKKLTLDEIIAKSAGEVVMVTTVNRMQGVPLMTTRPCMLVPIQFDATINVVTWTSTGKMAGVGAVDIELPKAKYGVAWYGETEN